MSYAHERLVDLEGQLELLMEVKPKRPTNKQPTIFQWAEYHNVMRSWTKHVEDIKDKIRQVRSLLEDDD